MKARRNKPENTHDLGRCKHAQTWTSHKQIQPLAFRVKPHIYTGKTRVNHHQFGHHG